MRAPPFFQQRVADVLAFLFAAALAFPAAAGPPTTAASQRADEGTPVIIANAHQYDLPSKVNGQTYRVMIYTSPKLDLGKEQPVIYLFDGNYYFASACDAMGVNELSGIVVGIGYPSEDRDEIKRRRTFDLSLPNKAADKEHGGGDAFLRVVDEEIKPFVAEHFKIDKTRETLFGHSLGGLMVLREMFRNPVAFTAYCATSPSIWWSSRAVLADEDAFSKRVRSGELRLRLLITSAGDEQYHGDDAAQLEKAKRNGMIINATALAARLTPLDPKDVPVTREVLPDETHRSGSIASLVRSLNFAFQEQHLRTPDN